MPAQIAILASGGGTTAEAFIRASAEGQIDAHVSLIICNNPRVGIFERVAALNKQHGLAIACQLVNSRTHPAANGEHARSGAQTASEETAIMELLQAGNFDAISLMGYMKRIGSRLVHEFGWRPEYTSPYQAMMVNTHPGLLPATKGLYGSHVQEYVLQHHLPFGGQSLHIVADDYDDGPVVAEHKVAVRPDDDAESLFERVKLAEKKYLPGDIAAFIKNRQNYLKGAR